MRFEKASHCDPPCHAYGIGCSCRPWRSEPQAENDARRVTIDFTVKDDQGNELAWGGTGHASSLKALADELQAMVKRGEFPHGDRVFPPAEVNEPPTPFDPDDPEEAEFLGIPFRPSLPSGSQEER